MVKNISKQKGFTLIELLIVVAIIGLLASMILVGLSSFRTKGRDTRRVADLRQLQNGLEIYYAKNLSYPVSGWTNLSTALKDVGIKQVPEDPLNSAPNVYDYASDASRQSYVLKAVLEDPTNNALNEDSDTTEFGIDCSDDTTNSSSTGNYCVEF